MASPHTSKPKKVHCHCIQCSNEFWTIRPRLVKKCRTCRSKPGFYARKNKRTMKVTDIFREIKFFDFDYKEVRAMEPSFEFNGGKIQLVAREAR